MELEGFLDSIREEIERDDGIREKSLQLSRTAVRKCSESIKMSHRGNFEAANSLVEEAHSIVSEAQAEMAKSSFISKLRILDTAYQELAEAVSVLCVLEKGEIVPPLKYNIPSREYLTGLADTIGELRRAVLENLRNGRTEKGVELLAMMESIFEGLNSFDFPNALIPDLRRKSDVGRALIERTRADVTTAVRQDKLMHEIRGLEEHLGEEEQERREI
jgi:translin